MKKAIRYIAMFAVGWFTVEAFELFGIFIKGEDGGTNWAAAAAILVVVLVLANLLDKPLRKLTGEIE